VNRKHEILRFLSKIIEMQKNIEMQSILSICTPTIDVEPKILRCKAFYQFAPQLLT